MSSSQANKEDRSPEQDFYSPESLLSSEKTESTLRRSGRLQGHLPPPDSSIITRAHSSAEVVQLANNEQATKTTNAAVPGTEVNINVHNNTSDEPTLEPPKTSSSPPDDNINNNDKLPHNTPGDNGNPPNDTAANHDQLPHVPLVNNDHGEPPFAEAIDEELQDAIPQRSQPSTTTTTTTAQPRAPHLRLLRPRTSPPGSSDIVFRSLSSAQHAHQHHSTPGAAPGNQVTVCNTTAPSTATVLQPQSVDTALRRGSSIHPLVDLTTTTTPTPNPSDTTTIAALHAVTDALTNITDRLVKLEEKSDAPATTNFADIANNATSSRTVTTALTAPTRISPTVTATCLDSHDDNLHNDALTKAMLTA
ncbi:hypothetical protein FOZ63_031881, partial [Perkinsus olseni]